MIFLSSLYKAYTPTVSFSSFGVVPPPLPPSLFAEWLCYVAPVIGFFRSHFYRTRYFTVIFPDDLRGRNFVTGHGLF